MISYICPTFFTKKLVESVTLQSKTIEYRFGRGKNPIISDYRVRLPHALNLISEALPRATNNGGDGGSRTHVQNGLKQTSTGVDFVVAQLNPGKIMPVN